MRFQNALAGRNADPPPVISVADLIHEDGIRLIDLISDLFGDADSVISDCKAQAVRHFLGNYFIGLCAFGMADRIFQKILEDLPDEDRLSVNKYDLFRKMKPDVGVREEAADLDDTAFNDFIRDLRLQLKRCVLSAQFRDGDNIFHHDGHPFCLIFDPPDQFEVFFQVFLRILGKDDRSGPGDCRQRSPQIVGDGQQDVAADIRFRTADFHAVLFFFENRILLIEFFGLAFTVLCHPGMKLGPVGQGADDQRAGQRTDDCNRIAGQGKVEIPIGIHEKPVDADRADQRSQNAEKESFRHGGNNDDSKHENERRVIFHAGIGKQQAACGPGQIKNQTGKEQIQQDPPVMLFEVLRIQNILLRIA